MSETVKARGAAEKADFLRIAKDKFPKWDENAKLHLKNLSAQNARKPLKPGLDHFIKRYLEEMQENAKSPRKKKPEAEPAVAAVASPKAAAKQACKPASEQSQDKGEDDPLLENVGDSLLARSAADDEEPNEHGNKTLAEICEENRADGGPGIRDGDVLMEKADGKSDVEENLVAVNEAERRQLRNRKRNDENKTESDDEPLFAKKAKPAITKDAAKPKAAKPAVKKQAAKGQSAKDKLEDADGDSEEEAKVSRFKRKAESQIMSSFDMAVLRAAAHKMIIARDGTELKDGAPNRLLNMHLIFSAARAVFSKQESKNFETAMMNAFQTKADQ